MHVAPSATVIIGISMSKQYWRPKRRKKQLQQRKKKRNLHRLKVRKNIKQFSRSK